MKAQPHWNGWYIERLPKQPLSAQIILALLLLALSTSAAQMKPGDRRKAYGETRASVIESLLATVYPGADVVWDPALMLRVPGDTPRMVEVPVYVRGSAANVGLEGIATIELEGKKEQYIFEAQGFRRADTPVFPTELFVFRANTAGRIQKYKKLVIDEGEPLTEVKTMSMQDWSQKEWPVLELQYDTHRVGPNSFTTIEWHSTLDANTGQFITRLPFGITRKVRGGSEQPFFFGISRNSPTTLLITNRFGGETHPYNCSDPCVMDADTLLSEWKLNDGATATKLAAKSAIPTSVGDTGDASQATIHLKNGRTVHADSVKEADDKIEYTLGDSVYGIPKSLVQEIVPPANARPSSQNDNPGATTQPSTQAQTSQPQTAQSSCNPNPHAGCPIAFFIQVLMGLGETQRFALLDHTGRDITGQAHWNIIDAGAEADFSIINGVPHVFSRKYGVVELYATQGDTSAMARIYIAKPEEINTNTMGRKGTPTFTDNRRPLQIVPADAYVGRIQ